MPLLISSVFDNSLVAAIVQSPVCEVPTVLSRCRCVWTGERAAHPRVSYRTRSYTAAPALEGICVAG